MVSGYTLPSEPSHSISMPPPIKRELKTVLNALDFRLAIKWPLGVTILSDRDRSHPMLTNKFEGFSEKYNHAEHH